MLEYLFYPVLYRTQLDPTTQDCEFSQLGLLQVNNVCRTVHLRQGKVYIEDQCIFSLPQACAIALITYHRKYGPGRCFCLLASDMMEYYITIDSKLLSYNYRSSLLHNEEDELTAYLRFYKPQV
jgi:hypothetical protein